MMFSLHPLPLSSCCALTAPALIAFQNSCVVPLGTTAMVKEGSAACAMKRLLRRRQLKVWRKILDIVDVKESSFVFQGFCEGPPSHFRASELLHISKVLK